LLFSSQLPVATAARITCVSKRSLDPSLPAPNFTQLTQWDVTLKHKLDSDRKELHGYFALHAGGNFTFAYCGWLCVPYP
jgi:hypothetical protein